MNEQEPPAPGERLSPIFRGALAGAQLLAFVSLAIYLNISMNFLNSGIADPCFGAEGGAQAVRLALTSGLCSAADIAFFWLLYSTGLRAGLKMAMVWGVLSVVLEVGSRGRLLYTPGGLSIDLGMPYCALHLAIAGCAGLAYVTRPSEALWPKKSHRKFWAWTVAAVAMCGLMLWHEWHGGQNVSTRYPVPLEVLAVGSLRTITTAAATYSGTYEKGFPESLAVLGMPEGVPAGENSAQLVDNKLASGLKNGYRFRYEVVERDSKGRATQYRVFASPVKFPQCGTVSFMTDQSGVIRQTYENREANAQDPPRQ